MNHSSSESEGSSADEDRPSASLIRQTESIIMEALAEHQKIKRYNTVYSVTTTLGIILIILTYVWLDYFLGGFSLAKPNTEFNWHPLLMVIGMIFMYSQSMLIYRTGRRLPKLKLKLIHAGLNISILILIIIALKTVFDSHNYASPPIPNLYSLHSWLGLSTVILYVLQFLVGFSSFLYPGASKNLRSFLLPYHVIFGSSCFVMAVITSGLGFAEKAIFFLNSKYQTLPAAGTMLNFIGLLLVIFGVLSIHLVNDTYYKREERIEDEVVLSE